MSQTVLITGASRGIGAEIARQAAAIGFDILINYASDKASAESVAEDVRQTGQRAEIFQADMGIEDDILSMFEFVDNTFESLDVVVNNAGITGSYGRLEDLETDVARRVLDVNVLGCLISQREAVKRMSTKHGGSGGRIINISSIAAKLGSPGEYIHYAASKAALDAMTVGLAKEVAKEGILVNSILPGIVDTEIHASTGQANRFKERGPMLPMGRGGQPSEIANAVMWLLDENNTFTSGACIPVAGGL